MKRAQVVFVILVWGFVSLACGVTTTGQISTAVREATQNPVQISTAVQEFTDRSTQPTSAPTKNPTKPVTKPTQGPTAEPKRTEMPTQAPEALILRDKPFFHQDEQSLTVIFFVDNPNAGHSVENSQYQLIVSDESGTVLETDSGYVTLILPNEKMAVASDMYLEKGQIAAKVEVQLKSGKFQTSNVKEALFPSAQVTYYGDRYFPRVTGVLSNSLNRSFADLRVTAVLYDQDDQVIGGGYSYLNFIPANAKTGFSLNVKSSVEPARTEIYTTVSSLTTFQGDNSQNDSVKLLEYGYGVKDSVVSVGFLAENQLAGEFVDASPYRVCVYDGDGNVLGVDEGYINTLFPGEKSGTAVEIYLPEGKTAANVEVQINPGKALDEFDVAANPFSTDQVAFVPGSYISRVTGILKNANGHTISNVEVNLLAYDQEGKIIGGGNTYVDFVPAEGQTAFEILVHFSQAPARMEAYPSFTSITKVEE